MEKQKVNGRPVGLVERRRRGLNLTQEEVAERAGIVRAHVTLVEGGYVPSEVTQRKLAGALGVEPDALWPAGDPAAAAASLAAVALSRLWRRLVDRLGPEFPRGRGDVDFEVTEAGRLTIHVGPRMFFEDDQGSLVVVEARGGRAIFGRLTDDGLIEWPAAPLADPGLN